MEEIGASPLVGLAGACLSCVFGFPDSSVSKESTCSAADPGSIPGLDNPLEKG